MRLGDIAEKLGCKLEGPEDVEITGVAGLEEAGPLELTFLSNPRYRRKLQTTNAAAIILSPDEPYPGRPALRSANPYLDFARALEFFYTSVQHEPGIHPTAVIAPDAKIGGNPSIGPYVVIESRVEIGDDCVIKGHVIIYQGARIGHRFLAHSHVVVRENVQIGNNVVLQNGAIIGSDGFGFARQADGSYYKIVQAGSVVIEDRVEVQANACIDRATVGFTRLRHGVKVDNLVQVGHACDIGQNTLLCGQSGLAGSCKIGKNVVLAGQVGVAGHLTIGDNVIATAQTGIPSDVEPNKIISGYPAMDNSRWLKCSAAYARLPEIHAAVRRQIKRRSPSDAGE
jgi:UDP-3-O-[3-hydroxymyristoyl] glucosamine N-acyltransferase